MVGILPLMDEDQQLEADAREMFDPATDIPDWYVDDEYEARVQAEIDAELDAMHQPVAPVVDVLFLDAETGDDVPF